MSEQAPIQTTYVEDVDRARVMAEAEDLDRSEAISNQLGAFVITEALISDKNPYAEATKIITSPDSSPREVRAARLAEDALHRNPDGPNNPMAATHPLVENSLILNQKSVVAGNIAGAQYDAIQQTK